MAAKFVMYKDGEKAKVIGLLVGEEGTLGSTDALIYQSVHIIASMFPKPARTSKRTDTTMSMQDRLGLHTFARGNIVEYTKGKDGEQVYEATVYGCIYHEPEDAQARKLLILADMRAPHVGVSFFLGAWPAWRRVRKVNVSEAAFDCENEDHVKQISEEACEIMLSSFKTSIYIQGLDTLRKAVRHGSEPPPV